jgi:hypothetical protein
VRPVVGPCHPRLTSFHSVYLRFAIPPPSDVLRLQHSLPPLQRPNLTRKGLDIARIGAHLDEGLSAISAMAEKIDLVSAPGPDVGHFRAATEQFVANRDLKGMTGIGLLTANEGRGRWGRSFAD